MNWMLPSKVFHLDLFLGNQEHGKTSVCVRVFQLCMCVNVKSRTYTVAGVDLR